MEEYSMEDQARAWEWVGKAAFNPLGNSPQRRMTYLNRMEQAIDAYDGERIESLAIFGDGFEVPLDSDHVRALIRYSTKIDSEDDEVQKFAHSIAANRGEIVFQDGTLLGMIVCGVNDGMLVGCPPILANGSAYLGIPVSEIRRMEFPNAHQLTEEQVSEGAEVYTTMLAEKLVDFFRDLTLKNENTRA